MAKFNFNLRNPGISDNCMVHLVVRYNNLMLIFPTGEHINPKFWNKNEQRAKQTREFPNYPEFNRRLSNIKSKAESLFTRFLNDNTNRPPTIEEFRKILKIEFNKVPTLQKTSLFNYIEQFIKESGTRLNEATGKPLSRSTILIYKNHLRLLKNYETRTKKRVDFDTIDLDFYHDFLEFLQVDNQFSSNTVGKHIKTLKIFLNDATERGINKNLAFKSKRFKVTGENVEAIYLNELELKELYNLNLSWNKRLEKARDLFLVGCWTGLRFSDFSQIKQTNIKDSYIKIETQKTKESVVIPIHKVVKEILLKYGNGSGVYLPPTISNAKLNYYLKEIGEMIPLLHSNETFQKTKAGKLIYITKKKYELITTHTARRSFATNLYLSGFPSISIMKITGHRTEEAFLGYIKVTPEDNAKLLKLHWGIDSELKVV